MIISGFESAFSVIVIVIVRTKILFMKRAKLPELGGVFSVDAFSNLCSLFIRGGSVLGPGGNVAL